MAAGTLLLMKPIPGTSAAGHLRENVRAGELAPLAEVLRSWTRLERKGEAPQRTGVTSRAPSLRFKMDFDRGFTREIGEIPSKNLSF